VNNEELQMKKLMVVAGTAALLAASSLAALAAEATGTIASIDATAGTVTLDDGKSYKMPTTVTLATFMPGQRVMITFTEGAAPLMASAISLAPAAGGAAPGAAAPSGGASPGAAGATAGPINNPGAPRD
jgi:hypothetical protein